MKIGCGTQKKYYGEIVLLHLIGAIMILMCHFTQKERMSALGELFITAVPLFLFIAGFLSGLKPNIEKGWIFKRAVRILTPFYLWVFPCLLVLWLSNHNDVDWKQLLFLSTNMQGLNYIYWKSELYSAVSGLGQLWFTTEIMMCYFLVPFFNKLVKKIGNKKTIWTISLCVIVLVIQPLFIKIGIQISYIITFFVGYLVSRFGCEINNKLMLKTTSVCIVITVGRFILMRQIDGTDYYDRYYALLSAAVIGVWIFFFVFWISSKFPKQIDSLSKNIIISFLSEISFEIYIVHFWFLNGKWQVANYISNAFVSDIIVVVLTIIFGTALHLVSEKLVHMLNGRLE